MLILQRMFRNSRSMPLFVKKQLVLPFLAITDLLQKKQPLYPGKCMPEAALSS